MNTATATAGSLRMRTTAPAHRRTIALVMAREALWIQHFRDPAVDDALAVGARVIGIDRKDLRALQYRGEPRFERDVGMRGHEVDLVFREQILHRRRGGPVDQLLAQRGILGTLDQRDPFSRRADALLRKTDGDLVAFCLGIQRIDDEEDAGAGLTQ